MTLLYHALPNTAPPIAATVPSLLRHTMMKRRPPCAVDGAGSARAVYCLEDDPHLSRCSTRDGECCCSKGRGLGLPGSLLQSVQFALIGFRPWLGRGKCQTTEHTNISPISSLPLCPKNKYYLKSFYDFEKISRHASMHASCFMENIIV